MNNSVRNHLKLLGTKARDRITGIDGIVTSIGFDLYGCKQAILNTGLDKEGKSKELNWFDANRLEVTDATPVMELPAFCFTDEEQAGVDCVAVPVTLNDEQKVKVVNLIQSLVKSGGISHHHESPAQLASMFYANLVHLVSGSTEATKRLTEKRRGRDEGGPEAKPPMRSNV